MKFLAIHDVKGNLAVLVSQPANMPRAVVGLTAGELATEVEVPRVTIDPADANSLSKLVEFVERYRVDVETRAKLSRKNAKTP